LLQEGDLLFISSDLARLPTNGIAGSPCQGHTSHSHADQNAIVLGAYGSPLLANTGIRPWYGSPFCKVWYWTTKVHNALEIDGQGQPKTAAATCCS